MKPVRILLTIASPIELPKFPIHLDALLYWALHELGMDSKKLDEILKQTDGIYHASALRNIRTPTTPLVAATNSHVTTSNWPEYDGALMEKYLSRKGVEKLREVKKILLKTGTYRRKVSIQNALKVAQVEFHAVGNPELIQWLLESLGFIGLANKQGFGEISSVWIEEIEHDLSWFDEEGKLARILPVSHLESDANLYLQQSCRVKPNYADASNPLVLSCIPNFRLKTIF